MTVFKRGLYDNSSVGWRKMEKSIKDAAFTGHVI